MNLIDKFNNYKENYEMKKLIFQFQKKFKSMKYNDNIKQVEDFLYFLDNLSLNYKNKYNESIFLILLNLHQFDYDFFKFENSSYYVEDDLLRFETEKKLRFHLEKNFLECLILKPYLLQTYFHQIKDNIQNIDQFINFSIKYELNIIEAIFKKLNEKTITRERTYVQILNNLDAQFFNSIKNINLFLNQIKLEKEHSYFFNFSRYFKTDYFLNYHLIKNIISEIKTSKINKPNKDDSSEENCILNFFHCYLINISLTDANLNCFKKNFDLFNDYLNKNNFDDFNNYHHYEKDSLNINKLFYFLNGVDKDKMDIVCEAILEKKFINIFDAKLQSNLDKKSLEILLNGIEKNTKKVFYGIQMRQRYNAESLYFLEALYNTYSVEDFIENNTMFNNFDLLCLALSNTYHSAYNDYSKKKDDYQKCMTILSHYDKNSDKYNSILDLYFEYFIFHERKEENLKLIDIYKESSFLNHLCNLTQSFPYNYKISDEIVIKIWNYFDNDDFEKFNERLFYSNLKSKKNIYFSIKERYLINNQVIGKTPDENTKIKRKRL